MFQDNYLSLDPSDKESFPTGWFSALNAKNESNTTPAKGGIESRLRNQIKADRLFSLNLDDSEDGAEAAVEHLDPVILEPELREKCLKFLSLPVRYIFGSC
jgi:hypothetical protein